MSKRRLPLILLVLLLSACSYYVLTDGGPEHAAQATLVEPEVPAEPVVPPQDKFGIVQAAMQVDEGTIRRNQTLAHVLTDYGVDYPTITRMVDASSPVFDVRRIRAGKTYRVYQNADSAASLRYFVYEKSPVDYVVFDLADSIRVYEGQREVQIVERTVEGTIDGSLYQTLVDAGATPELAFELAEMYAWQIDFYRIQPGDHFTVIYEEEQLDGQTIGVGRIRAARFTHQERFDNQPHDYYAVFFDGGETTDYYDEHGESLRKAFLKAPLRFTRISSRYTKKRFHPILKRNRPHLGTDYAAPSGTPVHTVGDGVVVAAGYTRGNGNYVKVRHNATYTTQYLHFSRIADGIAKGVRVQQGDVIGYVGSTGLATGPHLCYRFWKNGKQVDPYKQQIPSANPVAPEHLDAYAQVKARYMDRIRSDADRQLAAGEQPQRSTERQS